MGSSIIDTINIVGVSVRRPPVGHGIEGPTTQPGNVGQRCDYRKKTAAAGGVPTRIGHQHRIATGVGCLSIGNNQIGTGSSDNIRPIKLPLKFEWCAARQRNGKSGASTRTNRYIGWIGGNNRRIGRSDNIIGDQFGHGAFEDILIAIAE